MDQQTLRDWVIRFNERGPQALINIPSPGAAALVAPALAGRYDIGDDRLGKRQQATAAQTLEQSLGATVVRKHLWKSTTTAGSLPTTQASWKHCDEASVGAPIIDARLRLLTCVARGDGATTAAATRATGT